MPMAAFAEIPRLVSDRIRRVQPTTPWIASSAVRELERLLLEIGSGRSTAWYAERVRSVVSLEHDPGWHRQVSLSLSDRGIRNVDLRLRDAADFRDEVRDFEDRSFDVIIVDSGDETDPNTAGRVGLVVEAKEKLRPCGLLVLDNSDRRRYRRVDTEMSAWHVTRFVGLQVIPLTASETSIYKRK
jgi:predicted O-methyltransferase YrrM